MDWSMKQIENTNNPRFVKFDYDDICNIVAVFEFVGELSELEQVTLLRAKKIKELSEEKWRKNHGREIDKDQ